MSDSTGKNVVCHRGKLLNTDTIDLPSMWKGTVDPKTITVSLTPIGAYNQNLIVEYVTIEKIKVGSSRRFPINAYFHVYGINTSRINN